MTYLQPLSIVEDKGFRKFVYGLDPRYVLPSRRALTRKHLPNMHDQAVKRLNDQLKEASHVSGRQGKQGDFSQSLFIVYPQIGF